VNANDVVDGVKQNDDDAKVNCAKVNENDDARTIEIVVAVDDEKTRKMKLKTREVKMTMTMTATMNEVTDAMKLKVREPITNDDDEVDGGDANPNSS
jgi:hypothetical protein